MHLTSSDLSGQQCAVMIPVCRSCRSVLVESFHGLSCQVCQSRKVRVVWEACGEQASVLVVCDGRTETVCHSHQITKLLAGYRVIETTQAVPV
jgi:hypothetical protein